MAGKQSPNEKAGSEKEVATNGDSLKEACPVV